MVGCVGVQTDGTSNLLDEIWALAKSRKRLSSSRIEVRKSSNEFAVIKHDEFIEMLALQLLLKCLKCADVRIEEVRRIFGPMFGRGCSHVSFAECPSMILQGPQSVHKPIAFFGA